MTERSIEYTHEGATLEGLLAVDDNARGPLPGVVIAHAWAGRADLEDETARRLASQGYAGFAMDMYGKGVRGSSVEENQALIAPFLADRTLLQSRMNAAVEVLRAQEEVDASRIAAIGFCFGGLCVLDLARSGADVRGVVSLHGLFNAPEPPPGKPIKAKVLALHGHEDPMVPVPAVNALEDEMTAAGVDWQIHVYGGTKHAFTNPDANNPDLGTVYNAVAARRAWATTADFLAEVLA